MKCKFCGQELVASSKEVDLYLCYNCKKKFRIKKAAKAAAKTAEEASVAKTAEEANVAKTVEEAGAARTSDQAGAAEKKVAEKKAAEKKAAQRQRKVAGTGSDEERAARRSRKAAASGEERQRRAERQRRTANAGSDEERAARRSRKAAASGEERAARREQAKRQSIAELEERTNRRAGAKGPKGAQSGKKEKKGLPKIAIVIGILLVAIIIGAIVGLTLAKKKSSTNTSSSTAQESSLADSSTSSGGIVSSESLGDEETIGYYTIKITKIESCKTEDGSAGIKLYADWTNNSDEATCADYAFAIDAYQDNNILDSTTTTDGMEDNDNWSAEVASGESGTVWTIYTLVNDSDIDISAYELDNGESFLMSCPYKNLK